MGLGPQKLHTKRFSRKRSESVFGFNLCGWQKARGEERRRSFCGARRKAFSWQPLGFGQTAGPAKPAPALEPTVYGYGLKG